MGFNGANLGENLLSTHTHLRINTPTTGSLGAQGDGETRQKTHKMVTIYDKCVRNLVEKKGKDTRVQEALDRANLKYAEKNREKVSRNRRMSPMCP